MVKIGKHLTPIALAFLFSMQVHAEDIEVPQTIVVNPGSFMYRASGEYIQEGHSINAPLLKVSFKSPLKIMKYQVRVGDYNQCLAEGACANPHNRLGNDKDLPLTGVSYSDAIIYAKWLSKKTSDKWRLPTDEEWAFSAGSRFIDDSIDVITDSNNPAERWLAKYQKYADLKSLSNPIIKPLGAYGANENGIFDMSGNIWEWTDSCYIRTTLNAEGTEIATIENCGVHIAAGKHRAYLSFFVQDAKGGGCSVGAPPTYLGFRLVKVRESNLFQKFWALIRV